MIQFELRQIGREGSDCTAPYEVIIHGQCTVKEFVKCVLTHNKEWGYIGVADGSIFGNPKIEYVKGRITTENAFKDLEDYTVVKASASGGWSRMDYLITVERPEQTEPSGLINRAEVIDIIRSAYKERHNVYFNDSILVTYIENLPSVSAERVVRCKDCEYQGDELLCHMRYRMDASDYDFCSHGVWKGGAE